MNRKSLVSLTLISLISLNAEALTLTKGHLISHKEWSTGKVSLSFKDVSKAGALQKSALPKISNTNVYVTSSLTPMTGNVGNPVSISGVNGLLINNFTNKSHDYDYTYGICANTSPNFSQCAYISDSFTLEPNGTAVIDQAPSFSLSYDTPGTYSSNAIASVYSSEDGSGNFSESDSIIQIS